MANTSNYIQNFKNYWKEFFPEWDTQDGFVPGKLYKNIIRGNK